MGGSAAIRAEASRLRAMFEAAGAVPVEAAILQPAATLLDLYGEDIRARAYVTQDPLRGEQMLRPDFTVPVVQHHLASGVGLARYTYAGEVFRRQEDDPDRPSEYLQVGIELFGAEDPAVADAEIFALIAHDMAPLGVRSATGDIGILRAAIEGLTASRERRDALLRHLWRPRRFKTLLQHFGGGRPMSPARRAALKALADGGDPLADAAPAIGLRGPGDVLARLTRLARDAQEPPLPAAEIALVEQILAVKDKAPVALEHLRDIAVDLPSIGPAVARLADRLSAMERAGIDIAALDFEGSYGRTSLEYYDGFVFGLSSDTRPDLPPIATGGRYDALTRVLGGGRTLPAVGGVIRPDRVVALREAQR